MPQIHQSFTFCKRKRPNCLVNQGKVHTFAASLERGAGRTAFRIQNKDASQVVVKVWRDGRVVDYNGLENRRTERYRGFESLSLRSKVLQVERLAGLFLFCALKGSPDKPLQTIFACKNTRTLNPITKIRNDTLLKRKRMIDRLSTILSVIEHTR